MAELEIFEVLACLDQIEPETVSIDDLSLETQVSLLEAFKSWKDIEKGRTRGRGFANAQILNPKRDKNVFTKGEAKFKAISEAFGLNLIHEHRIKVKDGKNRSKLFKLDFFDPFSRTDVELDPDFHKSYKLVAVRDILREKLLKRSGVTVFRLRIFYKGGKTCIDVKKARKLCQTLKETQIKPSCLSYWLESSKM